MSSASFWKYSGFSYIVLQRGGLRTPPTIASPTSPAQWTPTMEMVRVSFIEYAYRVLRDANNIRGKVVLYQPLKSAFYSPP